MEGEREEERKGERETKRGRERERKRGREREEKEREGEREGQTDGETSTWLFRCGRRGSGGVAVSRAVRGEGVVSV